MTARRVWGARLAGWVLAGAVCLGANAAFEPVRVAGASMWPVLVAGDLAIVRRGAMPRAGDIVLLRSPGHGPVLHRVVSVGRSGELITRGDANDVADREPAEAAHAQGVVTAVVPVGRWLGRWR